MLRSEIKLINGAPTLLIDGKAKVPMAYTTYFEERSCCSDFAKAGYKIFFVNASFTILPINSYATGFSPFRVGIFEDNENPDFCSIDGNLYSKDESTLAFYAVGKSAEGFVIPDTVAVIGGYAFAFADSLLEVTIPEGVERIEDWAFYCCDRLLEIRIPSTVKYIGREALQTRGLTSAVFTDVVGWRTKDWPDDEVIIYISEEDLKNPSIAAKYLTNDYTYYSWTKE